MEIIEVIQENIEANDTDSIEKLVKHYLKTHKERKYIYLLVNFIVNLYSKYYINSNLWLLREITNLIKEIESNKNNDIYIKDLCILIGCLKHKNIDIYKANISDDDNDSIKRILMRFIKEFPELIEWKDNLTEECWGLLNILYENISQGLGMSDCILIINYLLSCKKKQIFTNSKKSDNIIDIIFMIIINYIEDNRLIAVDINEYLLLCKDLFYYRCKVSDKIERINILFYSFSILTHRRIKFQEIIYNKTVIKKNKSNHDSRLDYLYVIIPYDNSTINQLNSEKSLYKMRLNKEKLINIDNELILVNDNQINNFQIIKI